jgi:hypothetical protein
MIILILYFLVSILRIITNLKLKIEEYYEMQKTYKR